MTNKKDNNEYKRQMQKANAKAKYRDLSAAAKSAAFGRDDVCS
jgi:hypothetical protein